MTTETLENEFTAVLSTIADGLGIAAERIFGIFVSAQVLLGIIDIVSVILTLSGAIFFGWYARRLCVKWWRDEDGDWTDGDDKEIAIWIPIISAIGSLFLIWEIMSVFGKAAMMILCPEYSAMIEIIEMVIP